MTINPHVTAQNAKRCAMAIVAGLKKAGIDFVATGDIGDRGFTTLGSVTEPALQALGIRSYILRNPEEIEEILLGAQILAEDSKKPVAVLLTRSVLGVK